MRVGGRLLRAAIPNSAKHRITIPDKHCVIMLLIRHYHDKTHFGTEYVLSAETLVSEW